MVQIKEGKFSRFRCHTGHGFSEDALLEEMMKVLGEQIWQVTRGLQEAEMLLKHMGQHFQDAGADETAKKFFEKARELSIRSSRFQEAALNHESLSTTKLEHELLADKEE